MHYEVHDSSGTPLLLLHGGLFDIHQQFGELLPGKLDDPANHRGGRLKLAHPRVLTISRCNSSGTIYLSIPERRLR